MKRILFSIYILTLFTLSACNQKKTSEVTTEAEQITTTDSSAVVAQPDSLELDPETQATALQQDPPPAQSKSSTPVECNPNFKSLGKPAPTQHIIYVSGFTAEQFSCWSKLSSYGKEHCAGRKCTIYFVDTPQVSMTSSPPDYLSMKTLMEHGIGRFEFNGQTWELKGAKMWKRKGKAYGYYNTDAAM